MNDKNLKNRFPLYHTNWLNRRSIIDQIQHAVTNYASGLLLDVGCGAKQYQELFVGKVDLYLGLDLRSTAHYHGEAGPDMLASVLSTPLPSDTFDTVISFQVLEHVPEPHTMLAEMARVLKPDGYLILMAPQMWHLHEVPYDYFRYTRYGLAYLAERAGLTVQRVQPISGFWVRAGLVMSYRINQMLLGHRIREIKPVQIWVKSLITLSNLCFWTIDRLWPKLDDPVNNLMIAKKCK